MREKWNLTEFDVKGYFNHYKFKYYTICNQYKDDPYPNKLVALHYTDYK